MAPRSSEVTAITAPLQNARAAISRQDSIILPGPVKKFGRRNVPFTVLMPRTMRMFRRDNYAVISPKRDPKRRMKMPWLMLLAGASALGLSGVLYKLGEHEQTIALINGFFQTDDKQVSPENRLPSDYVASVLADAYTSGNVERITQYRNVLTGHGYLHTANLFSIRLNSLS